MSSSQQQWHWIACRGWVGSVGVLSVSYFSALTVIWRNQNLIRNKCAFENNACTSWSHWEKPQERNQLRPRLGALEWRNLKISKLTEYTDSRLCSSPTHNTATRGKIWRVRVLRRVSNSLPRFTPVSQIDEFNVSCEQCTKLFDEGSKLCTFRFHSSSVTTQSHPR